MDTLDGPERGEFSFVDFEEVLLGGLFFGLRLGLSGLIAVELHLSFSFSIGKWIDYKGLFGC